ncbi:MAG: hypothetical protein J7L14_03805 [Candidatus Diapherotrites archaeon]|nr:hypothetical protein [Candidatus Diapherotrites archaeon]
MPTGLPDYAVPVGIVAQAIDTLAVDIAAQSIAKIGVDIVAQSLGQLNVNIASATATLGVSIVSSTATLDINIAAQDIDVNIYSKGGDLDIPWALPIGGTAQFVYHGIGTWYSGAETNIYVVPPGKTFWLINLVVAVDAAGLTGASHVWIYIYPDGETQKVFAVCSAGPDEARTYQIRPPIPIPLEAGAKLTIECSYGSVTWALWGYETSAYSLRSIKARLKEEGKV